jgi:endonuclease/exonuclease/phosphatase family metal-dependent hydrolase
MILRKGLFTRIVFILNLIAAMGLGLSYLALFLSPENFWMLAFMGLAYPILLITNTVFMCFWLVVRWKLALFSGFFVLIGLTKIHDLYQFGASYSRDEIKEFRAEDSTLDVMSYNVRLFDLYNWTENKLTRNKIMDLLNKEQPDILCFQEFFHEDTGFFNTLDTLKQILSASNVHLEHTAHAKKVNHWGISTFTRFPIVKKGIISFKDSTDNISIFTDIKAYGDTIRIYNLHLESIRFRREDYKALKSITGNEDDTDLDGPQLIIQRMRRAYIRRARQTDLIREHMQACPHPIVLCGDFNDTPNSYAYHQISEGLKDAFPETGRGMGTTYIGMIPFLRIDYILYSPLYFKPLYFKTIRKKLSDHYPIVSTLKVLPQNVSR